jgi:hypothetical protein
LSTVISNSDAAQHKTPSLPATTTMIFTSDVHEEDAAKVKEYYKALHPTKSVPTNIDPYFDFGKCAENTSKIGNRPLILIGGDFCFRGEYYKVMRAYHQITDIPQFFWKRVLDAIGHGTDIVCCLGNHETEFTKSGLASFQGLIEAVRPKFHMVISDFAPGAFINDLNGLHVALKAVPFYLDNVTGTLFISYLTSETFKQSNSIKALKGFEKISEKIQKAIGNDVERNNLYIRETRPALQEMQRNNITNALQMAFTTPKSNIRRIVVLSHAGEAETCDFFGLLIQGVYAKMKANNTDPLKVWLEKSEGLIVPRIIFCIGHDHGNPRDYYTNLGVGSKTIPIRVIASGPYGQHKTFNVDNN